MGMTDEKKRGVYPAKVALTYKSDEDGEIRGRVVDGNIIFDVNGLPGKVVGTVTFSAMEKTGLSASVMLGELLVALEDWIKSQARQDTEEKTPE